MIILTYSIDSVDSFKNVLLKWKPALDEQNVLCPIVLAGLLFYFYPKKRNNIKKAENRFLRCNFSLYREEAERAPMLKLLKL